MHKKLTATVVAGIALAGGIAATHTSPASASPQPAPAAAPSTTTASATNTPAAQPVTNDLVWLAHTKTAINLRSAPSTHAPILSVIPQGYWVYMPKTQPFYDNHEDTRHWISVVVNGHTGYLNAGYATGKWLSNDWSGTRPQKVDAAAEKRIRAMGL